MTDLVIQHARLYTADADAPLVCLRIKQGIIASVEPERHQDNQDAKPGTLQQAPFGEKSSGGWGRRGAGPGSGTLRSSSFEQDRDCARTHYLDAGGRTIYPGLIDLHIHGAGGCDMQAGTPESLDTISSTLARFGVTGFLASAMLEPETGSIHLEMLRDKTGTELSGATLLGIHLEGPFLNPVRKGGLPERGMLPIRGEYWQRIKEQTGNALQIMTIAPELPGALPLIREITENGVVAAFAHSDADYCELQRGFEAGITHITHMYNAMRSMHHRDPGPIAAIMEHNQVTAELICDGQHVSPEMVRLTTRILGHERVVGVSDGISALGLPDGRYTSHQEYNSENGIARMLDGSLMGTTMPLHTHMKRFKSFTGCTAAQAVAATSSIPARILGLSHSKGGLTAGMHADLVIDCFEHEREHGAVSPVWATLVGGRLVWQKDTDQSR